AITAEMERYEGHLIGGDAGFSLRLNHDHSASMDWSSTLGTSARFAGTFTGADGNYVVTLDQVSGANRLHAKALALYLQGIGGMESGQYSTDLSRVKKDIAEITLTSV